MKYAVIAAFGSQYQVQEGQTISVNHLPDNSPKSGSIDSVLLIVDDKNVTIGQPLVDKASVSYEITDNFQGPKIDVFKYKAKSRYRKTKNFRHSYTNIKITSIKP